MPELFSNQLWTIIGVLSTICFGVVGILGVLFGYLQFVQGHKRFSYEIQSIAPVFTITEGLLEQLEIRLNGEIVKNAYLIVLKFVNTGRASIKPNDFVQPLKISIDNGNIISSSMTKSIPPELETPIQSFDKEFVIFNRILLNSKDEFTIQLLVSGVQDNEPSFRIEGRIDGVKNITKIVKADIKETSEDSRVYLSIFFMTLLVFCLGLILYFLMALLDIQPP